jgi:DNA-binding transcriptional LysR family regulator
MNILKLSATDLNLLPVFQVLLEERSVTTDYGAHVLLTNVLKRLYREAPNISLELIPWKEGAQKTLAEDSMDLATCTTDDLRLQPEPW